MATRVREAGDRGMQEMRSEVRKYVAEDPRTQVISSSQKPPGHTEVHHQHSGGNNPFLETEKKIVFDGHPPMSYEYFQVEPLNKHWEPVVTDFVQFNPDDDAKVLQKAMKGLGTDEKAIINVLTHRSNKQRQIIAKQFQVLYKKDLVKELKSELSGKLEDTILALMQTPEMYDAHSIHKAIAGLGTDEKTLIEIIGSRNPHELAGIKRDYKLEFKQDLGKDVAGDTSGFFKTLLLSRVKYGADDQYSPNNKHEVSMKKAYHEAQALWETGPKSWHKEPAFFVPIISQSSDEHLRQVFRDYKQIGHIDIEKDIEKELTGDVRDLLLAVVRVTKNRPAFFAERLNQAMKGIGVNAKTVIRIIVSRSEKDLGNIKHEYSRMYGKSLDSAVADEFSGDDKKVLLGILTQQSQK